MHHNRLFTNVHESSKCFSWFGSIEFMWSIISHNAFKFFRWQILKMIYFVHISTFIFLITFFIQLSKVWGIFECRFEWDHHEFGSFPTPSLSGRQPDTTVCSCWCPSSSSQVCLHSVSAKISLLVLLCSSCANIQTEILTVIKGFMVFNIMLICLQIGSDVYWCLFPRLPAD